MWGLVNALLTHGAASSIITSEHSPPPHVLARAWVVHAFRLLTIVPPDSTLTHSYDYAYNTGHSAWSGGAVAA